VSSKWPDGESVLDRYVSREDLQDDEWALQSFTWQLHQSRQGCVDSTFWLDPGQRESRDHESSDQDPRAVRIVIIRMRGFRITTSNGTTEYRDADVKI
jgi:hypothetical protein